MPPQLELVQQWLERAHDDLRAARLLTSDVLLHRQAGFHCQQAVEKALKAYLVFNNVEFEFVHSIDYLLDRCVDLDVGFEHFRKSADPLTYYAVRFRYPHSRPDPTAADAREAFATAEQVWRFVLDRLPAETHSRN